MHFGDQITDFVDNLSAELGHWVEEVGMLHCPFQCGVKWLRCVGCVQEKCPLQVFLPRELWHALVPLAAAANKRKKKGKGAASPKRRRKRGKKPQRGCESSEAPLEDRDEE